MQFSPRLYLSLYFPRQKGILDCIEEYLQESKYAYATLVMKGDRYVAGAAVLGTKLAQLRQAPIMTYCLVTPDVSTKAREFLSKSFDHVIQVPTIQATTRTMMTPRQRELYSSWISSSFTKWNVFNPAIYRGNIPKKVLLLDSDLLPRKNLDHLFELSAPAACFSNCWSRRYCGSKGIHEIYELHRPLRHGERISSDLIKDSLTNREPTFAVNAITVLIEPDERVYQEMLHILKQHQLQRIPYGFEKVFSGFDEQMLCQLMLYIRKHQQKPIIHLSPGYIWSAGKDSWVPEKERYVIHYWGSAKPWWTPLKEQYPDTKEWWEVAHTILKTCPEMQHYLFR